ncbi:hypothetical protein [Komagataeibacter europaeus]|uniref:hypothetical protein n=1 Tax=Komagataeibacter europaeus TaxID=33995 RepID=UPI00067FA0C6|nr:hypothetical protein [Komagataeibacter europaeus]
MPAMHDLSATLKLRPVRIALLTRPNDLRSIRKFMRFSVCLWGGAYNPIIPVMKSLPSVWRNHHGLKANTRDITRGYIRYFEPDAYVEAEEGLLEAAGLEGFRRKHVIGTRVLPLSGLMAKQHNRDWAEPSFGLTIFDAMRDIYTKELQFETKQPRPASLVKPDSKSLVTEAVFGCYPGDKLLEYFQANYQTIFKPKEIPASPDAWRSAFRMGHLTPLRFTRYKIEAEAEWNDILTLFVFDPASTLDCIDIWNMRSEQRSVLPVPVDWWADLLPDIRALLKLEHRPIKGNLHGLMHDSIIEFARSISEDRANELTKEIVGDLPKEAAIFKLWRTPVWRAPTKQQHSRDEVPLALKSAEKYITLSVDEMSRAATFETLAPEFAYKCGFGKLRWINTVQPSHFHGDHLGTTLPFNTFDPYSTMIQGFGESVLIGREGWSIGLQYKDINARLTIPSPESAVISALKRFGIEARLSEPGHIAKQILGHIDGLRGMRLLADARTLETLNTMAGGIRRKGVGDDETEELFDRRSKPVREWHALVERRKQQDLGVLSLNDFTSRNIIRLGLQSRCPNCANLNWHTLTAVDYDVTCERCQRSYPFPQSSLQKNNGNWSFRVVGPFAVPDYARGSYGALLALRAISNLNVGHSPMVYSTALSLSFDGVEAEADFVALRSPESHGLQSDPELIICEAKSFGAGPLITQKDIAKLRTIARKIEGSTIVISVLRNHFVDAELKLIEPFVRWCRRPTANGEMHNPVILLTGHEAFCRINIDHTWKELGGEHAKFAAFEHRDSLMAFAEATQSIHLGLKSYHAELREKREAKRAVKPNIVGE